MKVQDFGALFECLEPIAATFTDLNEFGIHIKALEQWSQKIERCVSNFWITARIYQKTKQKFLQKLQCYWWRFWSKKVNNSMV